MEDPERKRRGPLGWLAGRSRGFWIAAVVLAPVLYVGSFGPACWYTAVPQVMTSPVPPPHPLMIIYRPLGSAWGYVGRYLNRWAVAGASPGTVIRIPFTFSGDEWMIIPVFPND